jgi:hypothetical protein
MIADGFTKPLEGIEFQQFVQRLMVSAKDNQQALSK